MTAHGAIPVLDEAGIPRCTLRHDRSQSLEPIDVRDDDRADGHDLEVLPQK